MTDVLAIRQPFAATPRESDADEKLLLGVDTHAHVFIHGRALAPTRRYTPNYEASLDSYLEQLDTHGLAGGVLVQPSFYGTDNSFLLECLAAAPERLRGVVVVDPGVEPRALSSLRDRGVAGVRLNLIGAPPPDLNEPNWQRFLRRVADAGLHVEVQAQGAEWIHLMPPLLDSGARIVVDHFGRPSAELGPDDPGFAAIRHATQTGRVWTKMSGPYRFGYEAAIACARAFAADPGPERLLWGSDWPWTQFEKRFEYGECLDWLFDWLPSLKQRAIVLRDAPSQLYGFDRLLR